MPRRRASCRPVASSAAMRSSSASNAQRVLALGVGERGGLLADREPLGGRDGRVDEVVGLEDADAGEQARVAEPRRGELQQLGQRRGVVDVPVELLLLEDQAAQHLGALPLRQRQRPRAPQSPGASGAPGDADAHGVVPDGGDHRVVDLACVRRGKALLGGRTGAGGVLDDLVEHLVGLVVSAERLEHETAVQRRPSWVATSRAPRRAGRGLPPSRPGGTPRCRRRDGRRRARGSGGAGRRRRRGAAG